MHRISLAGLATLVALATAGSLAAQLSVELVRVPDQVTGSLDHGRNLIVTAEVHGTDVAEVWLAVDPDDADDGDRAPLTRAGPGQWQINLASGRAAELLSRYGKGAVAVHARTRGGDLASSVAIRFDVPPRSPGWSGDIVRIVAIVDGERRVYRALDDEELWFVPEDVERLDVRVASDDRTVRVELSADSRRWRFDRDDDRTVTLRVTNEISERWREGESVTLRVGDDCRIRLRAIPREIAPGDRHRFTVQQREERELPGSGGKLDVSLGDITAGQVRVEIRTSDGYREVAGRSMHEGDRLRFEHDGRRYVLELDQLINYLIGNDYAKLVVWRPADGDH